MEILSARVLVIDRMSTFSREDGQETGIEVRSMAVTD
jgi:hypothetical protein